jgi:hypothetical protein
MQTLIWLRLSQTLAAILLIIVLPLLHCGTAQATELTWTLQDARFDDGTLAVGTFTFDFVTNSVINFDISVSQSPGVFTSLHYTPATATVDRSNREFFSLVTSQPLPGTLGNFRHFDLGFGAFDPVTRCACSIALPETGGTVPIFVLAGSREQFGNLFGDAIRWMDTGTVVAPSPVPEPDSALFILTGVVSLHAAASLWIGPSQRVRRASRRVRAAREWTDFRQRGT